MYGCVFVKAVVIRMAQWTKERWGRERRRRGKEELLLWRLCGKWRERKEKEGQSYDYIELYRRREEAHFYYICRQEKRERGKGETEKMVRGKEEEREGEQF